MKAFNKKKGFTIVELVIVIAVIGVLTAVLVPTFVNLVNKANNASDESLVKNLNTQLRMKEQTEGKNKTLTDALSDAKEAGYLVENLTPRGDRDILWNQENDEFVFDNQVTGETYKYWKFYNKPSEVPATQTYSIYAKGKGWSGDFTYTVGFDAGENEGIGTINYVKGAAAKDDVRVRTNNGGLVVNADTDVVSHWSYIDKVDVQAVKGHSYHEYGWVRVGMQVSKGHVVAESDSYINELTIPETAEDASVKIEEKAEVKTAVIDSTDAGVEVAAGAKVEQVVGETENITGAGASAAKEGAITKFEVSNLDEWNEGFGTEKYIVLTDDITLPSVAIVNYDFTLDGQGHKLTSSANRVFRMSASNIVFNLKNTDIESTYSKSDSRGISIDSALDNLTLNIDSSSIKVGYYAINVTGVNGSGSTNVKVYVNNSTIEGYAAINNHASNAYFEVNDSTLIGNNKFAYGDSNAFATIVFDGSSYVAEGSTTFGSKILVNNSTVKQISAHGNMQCVFSSQYGNIVSEAWFNNIDHVCEGENTQYFNYGYPKANNVKIYIDGDLAYEGY